MVTTRALFFRDRDCFAKCVLRQRGFPWITLQQKIASDAMQKSKTISALALISERQSAIDACARALNSGSFRLERRQQRLMKLSRNRCALIGHSRQGFFEFGRT